MSWKCLPLGKIRKRIDIDVRVSNQTWILTKAGNLHALHTSWHPWIILKRGSHDKSWKLEPKSCWWHVASPTDGPSLKSVQSRLGITHTLDFEKDLRCLVYSENFPNSSRENAKNPKQTKNHTKLSTFRLDIHPSWVTYLLGTLWESHWIALCLRQLQGTKTLTSKRNPCSGSLCCPKHLHSTLQPRLSASSFNSLTDLSLEELPQFFHVTVVSLWWHRHAIEYFVERLVASWHKNGKICIMSSSFHSAVAICLH